MKYNYHTTRKEQQPVLNAAGLLALFVIGVGLYMAAGSGADKSIDSHNVNLCESAKVSGNTEYLDKCADYYKTGDVTSLR